MIDSNIKSWIDVLLSVCSDDVETTIDGFDEFDPTWCKLNIYGPAIRYMDGIHPRIPMMSVEISTTSSGTSLYLVGWAEKPGFEVRNARWSNVPDVMDPNGDQQIIKEIFSKFTQMERGLR